MVTELPSTGNSSIRRIVVVAEDNDILRRYFVDVLETAGYEVLEASDGLDALELLLGRPDAGVLLTDIDMPRMDGFTLACRARECHGEIDILYVSARDRSEVARRGVPGSSFLQKPCMPRALCDAMIALTGKIMLGGRPLAL
jgi:CheY-like chemotaxis protein